MYKVIIADDDFLVRTYLKQMIDWKANGFTIVGDAKNGREALRLIEQEKPALIITDICMPVLERMGKKKELDVYGRYFIAAVKQDWAGTSHQTKTALKKGMARIENKQLEERMREVQEQEENQDRANFYLKHAKDYVAAMTLSDLLSFMKRNASQLDYLAGRRGFNREHACSRKKTYREYRLLTQVVLGKMMAGEIPTPKTNSLFE